MSRHHNMVCRPQASGWVSNAEIFEKNGAAEVIDPNDLTAAILAERLMGLIVDNGRRLSLAASAVCLSAPEAAAQIVDRMECLISGREN